MSRSSPPSITLRMDLSVLHEALLAAWHAVRAQPVSAQAWLALAQLYMQGGWPWHTHHAHTQALRCAKASGQLLMPLADEPADACWGGRDAGRLLSQAVAWDGLPQVLAMLDERTQADPKDWLSWLYLARALEIGAPPQDAVLAHQQQAVRQALLCEVLPGETGHLMATWRLQAGDAEGALTALRAVLLQSPKRHGSWLLQARAQMHLGLYDAAGVSFARAAESTNPRFLTDLGNTLFLHDFNDLMLRVRHTVTQLSPDDPQAWLALAETQIWQQQMDNALHSVGKALQLAPNHPQALRMHDDLTVAGYSSQQFERDLARYEQGGMDDDAQAAMRLLTHSLYQTHLSADMLAALHRRIGHSITTQALAALQDLQVAPPAPAPLPWCDAQGRVRRLRVGYVSGDLHEPHPVSQFMLPVLQRHDRNQIEVFIYQTGHLDDVATHRMRECAEHWRDAAQLDDLALHQCIVEDRIDVLVDLAGHNASHRLGAFALRAAPAQLSYLGYPHSTGLPFIDWVVADAVVAPPEDERLFCERVARVSGSVQCWHPLYEHPLPSESMTVPSTPVVFASFNNLHKIDENTLAVWARVLHACPGSRLLLKSTVLADPVMVRRTTERFAAHGIGAERLMLRGPSELPQLMQEYLTVDVALDPFPYNGGSTSLQALWMGCPLVSLEGGNFVSRLGASFLHHLGRTEWLAKNVDEYVAIAQTLAREVRQRPWPRQAQRENMRQSGLCQIERHTRELEAIYQQAFLKSGYFQ